MSEDTRLPSRMVGRRVAGAVERVLRAGSRGARIDTLRAGPTPDPPADPAEAYTDDGHERLVRHHLGFDADTPGLGEYVEPPQRHDDATGGKSEYIRFPEFWRRWMRRQTPETLTAIDRVARREIERAVKRKIWSRTWKWAAGGAVGAFGFAHWGTEQIAWLKEKAPVLLEAWQWLMGLLT